MKSNENDTSLNQKSSSNNSYTNNSLFSEEAHSLEMLERDLNLKIPYININTTHKKRLGN